MLTGTRTVLHKLSPDQLTEAEDDRDDGVPTVYVGARYVLAVQPDIAADLGYPDTLTLTIDPGDLLNP